MKFCRDLGCIILVLFVFFFFFIFLYTRLAIFSTYFFKGITKQKNTHISVYIIGKAFTTFQIKGDLNRVHISVIFEILQKFFINKKFYFFPYIEEKNNNNVFELWRERYLQYILKKIIFKKNDKIYFILNK